VTIFFHNTLKIQGEVADAQPDLPVINGPHHEVGVTNVPWNELQWDGSCDFLDSVENLLAEDAVDGSTSDDGERVTDDEIQALMELRRQRTANDCDWYQMFPESQIEEQRMLQAALNASFEETKTEPPQGSDENCSTQVEQTSSEDAVVSSPKDKLESQESEQTSSLNNADPPSKGDDN